MVGSIFLHFVFVSYWAFCLVLFFYLFLSNFIRIWPLNGILGCAARQLQKRQRRGQRQRWYEMNYDYNAGWIVVRFFFKSRIGVSGLRFWVECFFLALRYGRWNLYSLLDDWTWLDTLAYRWNFGRHTAHTQQHWFEVEWCVWTLILYRRRALFRVRISFPNFSDCSTFSSAWERQRDWESPNAHTIHTQRTYCSVWAICSCLFSS